MLDVIMFYARSFWEGDAFLMYDTECMKYIYGQIKESLSFLR